MDIFITSFSRHETFQSGILVARADLPIECAAIHLPNLFAVALFGGRVLMWNLKTGMKRIKIKSCNLILQFLQFYLMEIKVR